MATRPTSDRLRETLFNVLAPRIAGSTFLDLYAGSGAVGIEALSRGAAQVVFVERAAPAVKILRDNLARLGIVDGFRVVQESVVRFLRKPETDLGFDLVFLDPPYDAIEEYAGAMKLLGERAGQVADDAAGGLLSPAALVIAEHRRKERLEEKYGALARTRLLEQGDAGLSFYRVEETERPE